MDRNYLSVRLKQYGIMEATIDEIRPITIENGEISICTDRALLCNYAIYLHQISNFWITSRKRVWHPLDLLLKPLEHVDTSGWDPLQ